MLKLQLVLGVVLSLVCQISWATDERDQFDDPQAVVVRMNNETGEMTEFEVSGLEGDAPSTTEEAKKVVETALEQNKVLREVKELDLAKTDERDQDSSVRAWYHCGYGRRFSSWRTWGSYSYYNNYWGYSSYSYYSYNASVYYPVYTYPAVAWSYRVYWAY